MEIRLLSFCVVVCIIYLAALTAQWLFRDELRLSDLSKIILDRDPENVLALGLKFKLRTLTPEELELIPSLTEESKMLILKNKEWLVSYAASYGKIPFEKIRGIGKKKAGILEEHIEY